MRALGSLACVAALSALAHAATTPTVAEVAADLGLDAAGLARVLQGKLVELAAKDSSERDLSVGFVFLLRRAPAEIAKAFRQGGNLSADPNVIASHRLAGAGSAADFASLQLGPHSADELKRYRAARPGDELNLSEPEIGAFTQLGPNAGQADIEARLRTLLLARYQAYRAGGLSAIAPYARAKRQQRSPADELRRMLSQVSSLLQKNVPAFYSVIANYPKAKPDGLEESFHWILYNLDNRPTVTLRHRLTLPLGDGLVAADREYYVGHGYNAMQALGALLPVDGGTMVFYGAHTSTDQVGGAATAMKHSIGRKVMAKQLEKIFEHFTRAN